MFAPDGSTVVAAAWMAVTWSSLLARTVFAGVTSVDAVLTTNIHEPSAYPNAITYRLGDTAPTALAYGDAHEGGRFAYLAQSTTVAIGANTFTSAWRGRAIQHGSRRARSLALSLSLAPLLVRCAY